MDNKIKIQISSKNDIGDVNAQNTPTENKESHGKTLKEWSFPEFNQYTRPSWWYIWLGIVSAVLLTYAFLTLNFLFAIFIVLVDIIFISGIINNPNKIKFSIKEDGIEAGKIFYSFKDLKNFWLIYEAQKTKRLYFEFKSNLKPILSIPLEKQNPLEIRKILKERLEENLNQEKESVSEQFEKLLKL